MKVNGGLSFSYERTIVYEESVLGHKRLLGLFRVDDFNEARVLRRGRKTIQNIRCVFENPEDSDINHLVAVLKDREQRHLII
jgi:hypothetical protein